MAEIRPFNALRYTAKAGDISSLVCPPYDIISEEERNELMSKNPYNAIKLEYNNAGEDIYKTAGENLSAWQKEGMLKTDDNPGLYIYEEEFTAYGKAYKIKGLISLIRLEEFEKKIVLPHEETLDKAKADRLNLMNATACNFSSIYLMYHDKENEIFSYIDELSKGEPDQSFKTGDEIRHNLWFVYDENAIAKLQGLFADKQLYIADGHHRYTTMINYRNQLREEGVNTDSEHPSNFGMMTMMNIENPGLVVFPTHRVVRDMSNFDVNRVVKGAEQYFNVDTCKPEELENRVRAGEKGAKTFGLYADGKGWLLTLKDLSIMEKLLPEMSSPYRGLDVTVLHTLILEGILGIDKTNMANQINLTYERDAKAAMETVDCKKGDCAFLINATSVGEIADVADADEKMPQKSTYFYPKLITGHVMYKMFDI